MYMTVSFAEKLFVNFFPSNGKRDYGLKSHYFEEQLFDHQTIHYTERQSDILIESDDE